MDDELILSRIFKKPIWLGLKVKQDDQNSFYDLGIKRMDNVKDSIVRKFIKFYPEFQGFAMYQFDSYYELSTKSKE